MSDLVFSVVEVLIRLLVVVFVAYILPPVRQLIEKLLAEKWAKDAVNAAQQLMNAKTGAERKEYVVEELTNVLNKNKIDITEEQINILIESAVKQLRIEEAKANTGEQ